MNDAPTGSQRAGAEARDSSQPGALLDGPLAALASGARDLPRAEPLERAEVARRILERVALRAGDWVDAAARGKSCDFPGGRAEEVFSGPSISARYLAILCQSLESIAHEGRPRIPGRVSRLLDGRLRVPVFPARGLFDALLFPGLRAEVWMQSGVEPDGLHGRTLEALMSPPDPAPIACVLGAGNVSAIPVTDTLSKVLQESRPVLLKLSPVNEHLGPIFEDVLVPAIERGWLRIVSGGAEVGALAIARPEVAEAHVTGSHHTHDAIVWGGVPQEREERKRARTPLLQKPITSELGNVTPWVLVPGDYSGRELSGQAMSVAASLVNNAGFNCLTTRVIVTWRRWRERERFLDALDSSLGSIPHRTAYYPGALERYERATGRKAPVGPGGTLPWTVLRGIDPSASPHLLEEESFVCVAAEVALDAESPLDFLERAAAFCDERLFGTLCAAITVPRDFRKREAAGLEAVVGRLRYGTVCLNQWPGLVYGLMTPPWGAHPGGSLEDVQSGLGSVHNLLFLDAFEKTVLEGPVASFPKPVWFPTHRRAETVGRRLVELYRHPSVWRLPGVIVPALLG